MPGKPTRRPAPPSEFADADEFFAPPMVLPVHGKPYTIPEIDIETGLLLTGILNGDAVGRKMKGLDLYKRVLGPAYDEMVADGVGAQIIIRAGQTVLADFTAGRDVALATWRNEISPEALAAAKAAIQQTGKSQTPSTRSRSSASGSGTRSRASSPRTTSQTGTPRSASPRKAAPGRPSA